MGYRKYCSFKGCFIGRNFRGQEICTRTFLATRERFPEKHFGTYSSERVVNSIHERDSGAAHFDKHPH